MLQTQSKGNSSQQPVPSAPVEQEFPAPARDIPVPPETLAREAFASEARSSVQTRRVTALTVLNELDSATVEVAGVPLVSKTLTQLGSTTERAAAKFSLERGDENRAEIIHLITGIPAADIQARLADTKAEDPEAVTRKLIQEVCKSEDTSIREIIIQSIAKTTNPNINEYETHLEKVAKEYEKVLNNIAHPKASDILKGFGKALSSTAKSVWNSAAGPLKTCGLFVFHSVITHNLPMFVKDRLKERMGDWTMNPGPFLASAAIGGVADLFLAMKLFWPNLAQSAFSGDIALMCFVGSTIGGFAEILTRALLNGGPRRALPGWVPLELALVPFRLIGGGLGAAKKEINEAQARKLTELRQRRL